MKAYSMRSDRSCNRVPNQVIVNLRGGANYFCSYGTTIARVKGTTIMLDEHWQHSRTTSKYLHQFLNRYRYPWGNCRDIQRAIREGNIIIANLNLEGSTPGMSNPRRDFLNESPPA